MNAARRVGRLELSAPGEHLVRRGALLVEDALATASLPVPAPGRLLLIRSLDLGRIRATASPASVALRLEARLREAGASAVWAGDPRASWSGAVWFRDAAEAVVLLARRLVGGQETAAWFWRRAVPAWRPEHELPRALRALLFAALESPAGLAAAVELVRALLQAGALEALAAGLAPSDGPLLLRASGGRTLPAPRPAAGIAPAEIGAPALDWVQRCIQFWEPRDARAVWTAAALLLVEHPARIADLRLPERAALALKAAAKRMLGVRPVPGAKVAAAPLGEPSPPTPLPPRLAPSPGEGRRHPERQEGRHEIASRTAPVQTAAEQEARLSADAPIVASRQRTTAERAAFALDGAPTAYAGLFFLLPVLTRLGIANVLDSHPHLADQALAARILDRLARRLGATADDPVRGVLEIPAAPVQDCTFRVPERWRVLEPPRQASRTGNRHRPSPGEGGRGGGRGDGGEGLLLDAWLTAARRWCRRSARIGLASLVRRPGLLSATRTHLDVTFELRRADIRVRRAGLDLDPGWLPWLGRVVSFHYERLEAGDGRP